ncbi:TolC family protein [bacterium]|nr:TolC family protein [bacterium]
MKQWIFLIILLIGSLVFAQEKVIAPTSYKSKMTLDQCIEHALEYNNSISLRRESLIRSRLSHLNDLSEFMPNVSARFSWSRSEQEGFSYSESGLIISKDHYSAGLSANQTLFSGGRNILAAKSSAFSRDICSMDLWDNEASLIFNVKNAFFSVVSAKRSSENAEKALERIGDQMNLVNERDKLGLADPTEVTQIKVSYAQNQLAHIQAKNALEKAIESIAILLAYPLDSEVELIDEELQMVQPKPLDQLIAIALDYNPQIKQGEIALKQAKLSKASSWSYYVPGVNASYSYNWSGSEMSEDLPQFDDEATWNFGVSANWTIFSGTSRITNIKTSNSLLRDSETNLAIAKRSVEASVRDAYRQTQEASARITLAGARLDDTSLNQELFNEKYKLGDCTLLELLQAELSLQEAETEAISAKYDYNMAVAELVRLTGDIEN